MNYPSPIPLPSPEDKIEGGLKPHERKQGIYVFHRDPWDDEVTWKEPGPQSFSYLLPYFESVQLMKNLLRMDEEFLNRVNDMLWNFYTVAVNLDLRRCVALRESDADGWENEIRLQFPGKDEG